jgi:hypothetical protein
MLRECYLTGALYILTTNLPEHFWYRVVPAWARELKSRMEKKMLCGPHSLRNTTFFIAGNSVLSLMPLQNCQHREHR